MFKFAAISLHWAMFCTITGNSTSHRQRKRNFTRIRVKCSSVSSVSFFATPWTVDPQVCPWTFPGNNASVSVLVAQSCPTLCDPMDCSPPGPSVHGILQARILERVPFRLQGTFPTQVWNLHCRQILYCLRHP